MLQSPLHAFWDRTINTRTSTIGGYPPADMYYKTSDATSPDIIVDMAVAGFTKDEITVSLTGTELLIEGKHSSGRDDDVVMIYNGISRKSFSRKIELMRGARVKDCSLTNGILSIVIEVEKSSPAQLIPIN